MVQRDDETTRRRLLEATIELIDEIGAHAIRLRDVAVRTGVSNGAIYWSFKDRDALVDEAVIERYVRRVERMFDGTRSRIDAVMRGEHDADLGGVVRNIVGPLGAGEHRDERMMAEAAAARNPELAKRYHDATLGVVRRAAAEIERAQAKGYVRADVDALSMATFVNALSIGLAASDFLGSDGPTTENWAQLVNLLLGSFLTAAPQSAQ